MHVVLKLLKMAQSVRTLLDTVVQALPEVSNLGLLFFLLFFIFAALGVELFGRVGEYCSVMYLCVQYVFRYHCKGIYGGEWWRCVVVASLV